jgi:NAD(P)-dependent dehydrogenase (short-subunit alcohol dehydrogenase family)
MVTGATRGIGYATAAALLNDGHQVAIAGTSASGVARAEHRLGSECGDPGRLVGLVCDVRNAGAVELAMQTVEARFGGLDVLVNCAGVGIGAPVADLPLDEWHRIVDTNLTGVFHCCRAAIPRLRAAGGGFIVNISSLSSTSPFAGGAAYCASKAAVNAFSDALMQELRHDNIRVSCVLPGSVATGFSGREAADGADWKLQPEDIARAIVDLLAYPSRSLPSRIEIRPSRPRK